MTNPQPGIVLFGMFAFAVYLGIAMLLLYKIKNAVLGVVIYFSMCFGPILVAAIYLTFFGGS